MESILTSEIHDENLRNLKQLAAKTGDLPPMPVTALKALQMTEDPNVTARALQSVISMDQALSARILRIVNSAMYCLSREVSTVSHAVSILGMDTIRSIIMAASVQHMLKANIADGRDLGTKLLSDHSWGAALAARAVAMCTQYRKPEEAFLSGLMHDLGKPVMLKNLGEAYGTIVSEVYNGGTSFHEAEMAAFGFTHAHVGALLAEKWNFPPQLQEAIGYHHNPTSAPQYARLACITDLSNAMMILLGRGFERNPGLELDQRPSAQYLGLTGERLKTLLAQVQQTLELTPDPMSF